MLKSIKEEIRKGFTIKVRPQEKRKMQELADKYADGNLSLWVRYAAMNCSPTAQELSNMSNAEQNDENQ